MSGDLPLLRLARQVDKLSPQAREQVVQAHIPQVDERARMGAETHEALSQSARLFNASVKGVQTRFKHLSTEDISYPPQAWPDASFARQVAVHITVQRFNAPIAALMRDFRKGHNNFLRAVRSVDERMVSEDFAQAYEDMARAAEENLED